MWAHLVAVTFVFREPHPLPFPSRGFISSRPPFFYLGRSSPGTGSGTGKEKAWISGAGRSSSLSGRKKVSRPWFAFQTRSANDILDDGYRWRKYNAHPRGTGRCREARGLLGARVAARLPPLVERAGHRRPPWEPWSAWAAAEEHGSQPVGAGHGDFFFFFLVFRCMWDCIACIYLVIDSLNDLWDLWILHQSIHILSLILRMIWHYW
ncbi:uncharacterized protein LOC120664651 isoform X2 [Panicum virgatum]|uniref:uncharacterized protein LOC120664651 isoform X2 n=1 Tax=Panicum virgatum TaxID=38727 RepID=UPI0019D59A45|nr:uncharacterized protein LOC120664651 isoform X2 [Panicum virgatum]